MIIYIDEVFEDLIEVIVGVGDNEFVIIIDENVDVSYDWMKEIWSKIIKDVWNNV